MIRQEIQKYADKYNVGLDFINNIFSSLKIEKNEDSIVIDSVEIEETVERELEYDVDIDDIVVQKVSAPDKIEIKNTSRRMVRAINEEEAAIKEKNKKKKGNRGEEIAIRIERDRLMAMGREDLITYINHIARQQDGCGYDIESVTLDENGEIVPIYIEVKTTEGDITRPFYISDREVEVSEELGNSYYIYRIFNLKENNRAVQYYVVNGSVKEVFDLKPISYMATVK